LLADFAAPRAVGCAFEVYSEAAFAFEFYAAKSFLAQFFGGYDLPRPPETHFFSDGSASNKGNRYFLCVEQG